MNLEEFKNKYLGKSIDYDGVSGVQCVDLIKQYMKDVFNLKPGSLGNAKDYYLNYTNNIFLKTNFNRISQIIPKKGDILVWNNGKYGHVAIAIENGNENICKTIDLNYGSKLVTENTHNYFMYLGVLRIKNKEEEEEMKTYKNGSTTEDVFADTECTNKIGSLDKYEQCECYGIFNDRAVVRYKVNGTNNYKVGFVKWLGGVK